MSVQRQRGNDAERGVARYLDGDRVGHLGAEDVTVEDWLVVEVKERQNGLAGYVYAALDQAAKNAGPNQTPAAVFHRLRDRRDNDVVMLRLSDFRDLCGGL